LGADSHRLPDPLEVLEGIDTDRVVTGLDCLDTDPMLERAKLFEGFGLFERRRAQMSQT
jgi:hypothetical protein